MNWTGCDFVERVEGRCGGAPMLIGTRILQDTFIQGADDGMTLEEMHENSPSVSVEAIEQLIAFARDYERTRRSRV
jgi:uncharacterized protein (DUF433 family)